MNEVVCSSNAIGQCVPAELSLSPTSDATSPFDPPVVRPTLVDGISTTATTESLGPDKHDDCSEVTVCTGLQPLRGDSTDRRCQFTLSSDPALLSGQEQPEGVSQTSNVWKNTLTTLWTKHRRSALTGIVIAVVWVLILLPALSYHIPGEIKTTADSNDVSSNISFPGTANISIPLCSEGFYLREVNLDNSTTMKICQPECGKWEEFPHSTVVVMKGLRLTGSCLYILGGAILLAVSVVLRHRMFKFPSVFVVYLIISVGILEVFSLVSHSWESLFCSSPDLLDSIDHPSPYCTVTGMVQYYVNMQGELIWFFHIIMIFWGIQFPFHRRINVGYTKYIHLTMVLCVLLIPAVFAGIPFATGGYSPKRFPPDTCHAADPVTIYYVYMLPSAVVSVIGVSLLVIVFRNIIYHMHKSRRHSISRSTIKMPSLTNLSVSNTRRHHQQEQLQIGVPEIKMAIVGIYFLVIILTIQVAFAVALRHQPTFQAQLTDYFSCEAAGQTPGKSCEKSFRRLGKEITETAAYFIFGFYPFVLLFHVVNIDELKVQLKKLCNCVNRQVPLNSEMLGSVATTVHYRTCSVHRTA